MKAGGMPPGRDPPVRVEPVHESERTRVTRLFLAGRTVIRKEPLGPDAEHRLRHEVAILERLRGVAGVAQLAEAPRYPGSIVLEDTDGTSLASSRTPYQTADGVIYDLERSRDARPHPGSSGLRVGEHQLRPVVTGRDGWFVAGKFDQYRRDPLSGTGISGIPSY